ncbi:MAG: RNA polymerase sigma factor [Dermatophilaceae bacterium]
MPDGRPVVELVEAAASGDARAWAEIVERYASLVIAICRHFRLSDADLQDVSQTVWLRLVEHLPDLREPRALPGWLVTTSRRECLRVVQQERRQPPTDNVGQESADDQGDISRALLEAEYRNALREAFASLPEMWRELMLLLLADPPIGYEAISHRLGIPRGSIGPTRARAIERLRAAPPLADLFEQVGAGVEAPRRAGRQRSC